MSHALYEFMPYGAPDLITGEPRRLFRATLSSAALWMLILGGFVVYLLAQPKTIEVVPRVVLPFRELAAPPPLSQDAAPPPQVAIAPSAATAVVGTPVPTPDVEVPANQTIASQEEISNTTGSVVGDGDQVVVVEAPPVEELPKLGDYVYADELPVLVVDVQPVYPELARQAEVEGVINLRVLVGKDGRVSDVHIDNSIPMLDAAAVEAAHKWVFKPALSNNRPVAVWIARQLRFRLAGPLNAR